MVRKLKWRLRYYWRKAFGIDDGVCRADPNTVASDYTKWVLYYNGAPGDPGSDEVVGYAILTADNK